MKTNLNPHDHENKRGVYDGIEYIVFFHTLDENRGGGYAFYTAYIRVPEKHPWIKFLDQKKWFDMGLSLWKMKKAMAKKEKKPFDEPKPESRRRYTNNYSEIDIDVHGGISFGRYIPAKGKVSEWFKTHQNFSEGYWIGWDYGHAGDYNHSKEWHKNLMASDNPADQKLGKDLDGIGGSHMFDNDKDHSLEEVERDCIDAIGQLRRAENGTK